jgi:CDP-4-dehydro-6-deoxyglucose reductase
MYKIIANDREYTCADSEDLLTAARKKGVFIIPTGCLGGGCGMCKIKIVEGQYERGKCSKAVLNDAEREEHYSLACKTYPRSDMKIKV